MHLLFNTTWLQKYSFIITHLAVKSEKIYANAKYFYQKKTGACRTDILDKPLFFLFTLSVFSFLRFLLWRQVEVIDDICPDGIDLLCLFFETCPFLI